MQNTLLRSQELSCPSCVAKIETALKALDGVSDARVHFNTGKIEIQHDPQLVKAEQLVDAVWSVGYEASVSAY
jgi:copper chaperone CopZ